METPLDWGDLTENAVLQNLQTEAKLITRSLDCIELFQAQQHCFSLLDILMGQH